MPYSQPSPGAATGSRVLVEPALQVLEVGLGDRDGEGADLGVLVGGHAATLEAIQERFVPIIPRLSRLRRRFRWRTPRPGCWPCSACSRPAPTGPGPSSRTRLGVTDRTVRNDIDRLRGLGYPVDAVRGPGGRYRLGVGTKLPPLLLEEDEAVAVAVGLSAGTGGAGHRGDQRPGAGQARARAPPPAAAPGQRAARRRHAPVPRTPDPTSTTPSSTRRCSPRWRRRSATTWSSGSTTGRDAPAAPARALPAGELAAALVRGRPRPARPTPGRRTAWTGCSCAPPAGAGSPRDRCPAGTTRRSCSARWRSRAGTCTPASRSTRRPRRCSPGSTRPSAWSRAWTPTTACWSPAPTASRSSRSTSACSAWTSTSPSRRQLVEAVATGRGPLPTGRHSDFWNSSSRPTTR